MGNPEGITPASVTGATISTLYGERKLKVFPVLETELSTISYMNTLSTIFLAIGSFLLEKAIDFINGTFNSNSVYFLGALICFIVFLVTIAIRFHAIHKIKKQTATNIKI